MVFQTQHCCNPTIFCGLLPGGLVLMVYPRFSTLRGFTCIGEGANVAVVAWQEPSHERICSPQFCWDPIDFSTGSGSGPLAKRTSRALVGILVKLPAFSHIVRFSSARVLCPQSNERYPSDAMCKAQYRRPCYRPVIQASVAHTRHMQDCTWNLLPRPYSRGGRQFLLLIIMASSGRRCSLVFPKPLIVKRRWEMGAGTKIVSWVCR